MASGATREAASLCKVLEKTEQGLEDHEGWGGGLVSLCSLAPASGRSGKGSPHPPEAQYKALGKQGDCAHGAAQRTFEDRESLAHLPRTGA